jgi:hypothetical protein
MSWSITVWNYLERRLKNKLSNKKKIIAMLTISVKIKNDYQYQKLTNEK